MGLTHEQRQGMYYSLYYATQSASCKIVQTARIANQQFDCNMSALTESFTDHDEHQKVLHRKVEDCYIKHQPVCNRMCNSSDGKAVANGKPRFTKGPGFR
jgi:hypothetical protein